MRESVKGFSTVFTEQGCFIMKASMPFKYILEMICDDLAAGMTYQGKKWYPGYQLTYWNKVREEAKMNETMKQLLDKVYTEISLHGLKVLKRKQIKEWYDSYIK